METGVGRANVAALTRLAAAQLGVAERHIVFGAGSTELVDSLCRLLLAPGDEAIAFSHSFVTYRNAVRAASGVYREVLVGPDFSMDPSAIEQAITPRTKVVFLGNPSNPTGKFIRGAELHRFLERMQERSVLVVVDEANADYATDPSFESFAPHVGKYASLAVLETFSTIHGLASLRVGIFLGPHRIARYIPLYRSAFHRNAIAHEVVPEALLDRSFVGQSRVKNEFERAYLKRGLEDRGITVTPSQGNFLMFEVPRTWGLGPPARGASRARAFSEALAAEGVVIRGLDDYGLPNHCRVAVGTSSENARFLSAVARVLSSERISERPPAPRLAERHVPFEAMYERVVRS